MTTDNFFYLQNRLIQTSKTGGQWYSDTSPRYRKGAPIGWALALLINIRLGWKCLALAKNPVYFLPLFVTNETNLLDRRLDI
jgi:hypothetical protein